MVRFVIVQPHDPAWLEQARTEAAQIRAAMGANCVEIQHIGSTAVPGLPAKPILDFLGIVQRITELDEPGAIERLAALGYQAKGDFGLPGRRYFWHGTPDVHSHHLHIYQTGHADIERHLAFRDYLRANPEAAETYGWLKLQLAGQFPTDIEAYMDGKNGLIKELEQQALHWYRSRLATTAPPSPI